MTDLLSQSFRLPDGRTLTYAEYGAPNGKPVLYFHGLAGSRLEPAVLDNNDLQKAGIRMIACDRPGLGDLDFQPGRGFSHWPADMVVFADRLGLDKFAVLGVSGGGGYISACARLIPDRLTAAVIVSGAGRMDTPEARASLPVMNRLMWGIAGRSVRLMGLFLNVTKSVQGDPAKIRQQMMSSMPPVERAFFEKPGRLEAFIASGLESMRQGVRRGCLGYAPVCTPLGFPPGRNLLPRASAAWRSRPERAGSSSPQSRRHNPRLPGYFLPRRRAYIVISKPSG